MLALGFLLFHGTPQCCPPKRNKSNENYSISVTALKCLQKQKEKSTSWEGLPVTYLVECSTSKVLL